MCFISISALLSQEADSYRIHQQLPCSPASSCLPWGITSSWLSLLTHRLPYVASSTSLSLSWPFPSLILLIPEGRKWSSATGPGDLYSMWALNTTFLTFYKPFTKKNLINYNNLSVPSVFYWDPFNERVSENIEVFFFFFWVNKKGWNTLVNFSTNFISR